MLYRVCAPVAAAALLSLAGCAAKVNDSINASLSPNAPDKRYVIPKASGERTITVDVNSTAAEVDIYVFSETDDDKLDKLMKESHDSRGKKALAAKQTIKSGSLDATVPANTEVAVVVYLSEKAAKREKTEVTGKITSK